MIIETQEGIEIDSVNDLASTVMGGIWADFREAIPKPQGDLLTEGLNLILLAHTPSEDIKDLLDPEFLDGFTTSELPSILTNVLVNEGITINTKKTMIYEHITGNMIEALVKMGFVLSEDEQTIDQLPLMCKLVNVFFDLQGYEDTSGLVNILESSDIEPKERFLLVLQSYLGDDFDYEGYSLLVEDISEVTLASIKMALIEESAIDTIPDNIVIRVRNNKELVDHTLAYAHVRKNGQVGGSINGFLSFFSEQLLAVLEDGTKDQTQANIEYGKEIIAFYLISEINNSSLKDKLLGYLNTIIEDHVALLKLETLVNNLVLSND